MNPIFAYDPESPLGLGVFLFGCAALMLFVAAIISLSDRNRRSKK